MSENIPEERPLKRVRLAESDGQSPALNLGSHKAGQCTESDVGIVAYLNSNVPGFKGVLKQRYTDFLVNEVDLDGHVLRLNNLNIKPELRGTRPPGLKEDKPKPGSSNGEQNVKDVTVSDTKALEEESAQDDSSLVPFKLLDEDASFFVANLSQEVTDKLVEVYNEILSQESNMKAGGKVSTPDVKLATPKPIEDKETRSKMHQSLRKVFESKFISETDSENNITIWPARIGKGGPKPRNPNFKDNRNNEDRVNTVSFKELGGEYLHFTLYKENKETMECVGLLAKFLKIPPKLFGYAGTKDRRAVTVQRLCLQRIRAERVVVLNKNLKGFKVGDFAYNAKALRLGDLSGNEFCISLRDCDFGENGEEDVKKAIDSLRDVGFINYYGLQRFGTFSTGTHIVGKSMLRSDWRGAVELIMAYDDPLSPHASQDERERAEACKKWFTNTDSAENAASALKLLPRKYLAENAILRWLSQTKSDGNWLGAIQQIPRGLRLMFVHAYQSYIWNSAASKRIDKWGMQLHAGDLVIIPNDELAAMKPVLNDEEENMGLTEHGNDADEDFLRARPITSEEAESGQFTIYDMVLPTPGWDVIYPDNEVKDIYIDLMAKDDLNPLDMARNQKETSMSGHYRRVLYKPQHVDYEIKNYSGTNEQLIETDLQHVQSQSKNYKRRENMKELNTGGEGEAKKAIILKLRLGTSQYATMALRELMKGGTLAYTAVFDESKDKFGRDKNPQREEDVVMQEVTGGGSN